MSVSSIGKFYNPHPMFGPETTTSESETGLA